MRSANLRRISIWDAKWWLIGIVATTCGEILFGNSAVAQIVPDKTLGAERSVVTPNVTIKGLPSDRIDGGAIRGADLFHSFQEFNVKEGRGAYFSNPAGIENILTRVTGTNASNIFGKLGVLGNANLFLLNPNGIIFGPNASLDINGSFLGSTANSLNFGDGKLFSATNPTAPPLLTVKVPLGVQFPKDQPRAILNSGNLSAGTGQNLTLLGGTVVSTGQLSAPGGQVAVAAVPSGSVAQLSSSGQLLNIDVPSPEASIGSSASLTPLLASNDGTAFPGLTVNSNGQVKLLRSGLPVVDGDVVARNVTAQSATLTANHNLTLVESQLGTSGDLNLLAGDTVRVRDSVTNPFVAQAGGQLLVQGKQGVDIFALNNSSSGLVSGGDLVLRSANTVGGDAHYWAGGNFRIEKLDGSLGGLFSPYDPIIRASGDVSFQSYTGGSLHIFAGGSVIIPGTVTITDADGTNGLVLPGVPLSRSLPDGTSSVDINGRDSPTLDIRAGTNAFGSVGLTPNPIPGIDPPTFSVNPTSVPTSANIQIGSIRVASEGQVFLTNQYVPNTRLGEGSINQPNPEPVRGSINITGSTLASDDPNSASNALGSYSIISFGTPVTIDARGDVNIAQGILTGAGRSIGQGGDISILSGGTIQVNEGGRNRNSNTSTHGSLVSQTNGPGGDISLTAARNITTTGDITSEVISDSTGKGGDITLTSNFGEIDTRGITISSRSNNRNATTNLGGDVTLRAHGNIYSGNIIATSNSNSNSQNPKDFAEINLDSSEGTVFLNGFQLNTTNNGTGFAGDISINGRNIQINNNSRIESLGQFGRIFIGGIAQNNNVANNVTVSNSSVSTTNNGSTLAGDIYINGRNIQITNTGRGNNHGIQSQGVNGRVFIGIDENQDRTANNVTISNSRVDTQTINGVTSNLTPKEGDGIQIKSLGNIEINNSILNAATNSNAPSGSISLNARGSVDIKNNSTISIRVNPNATSPQQEINFIPTITLDGSSVNITDSTQVSASTFNSSRSAGDVIVRGRSVLLSSRGSNNQQTGLFAQAIQQGEREGGIAGNIGIVTDELTIENGATATVSSPQGQAGNLFIIANRIFLDKGNIIATTGGEGSQPGANIFLLGTETTPDALLSLITGNNLRGNRLPGSPIDLLYLGNESLIAANGGNNARGGNVAINTKLLIARPPTGQQGSDITATASGGSGGVIAIRAEPLGIYGIEFRTVTESEALSNDLNDITATSETGPAGIVSIRLPDVDPRRGLFQLPEDLRDSSRFIDPSCPVGGKRASSRFVVTGGGGLPPNPGSALNSDILLGGSGAIATDPENNSPTPIVEAQGVEIGPKGEIILAANPSKLTSSYRPWQPFTRGCHGK